MYKPFPEIVRVCELLSDWMAKTFCLKLAQRQYRVVACLASWCGLINAVKQRQITLSVGSWSSNGEMVLIACSASTQCGVAARVSP